MRSSVICDMSGRRESSVLTRSQEDAQRFWCSNIIDLIHVSMPMKSNKSDPISLLSGPYFTDPIRPLFSGYTRLIDTSADGPTPSPVGIHH
jgi:hypothetical protein